MSRSKEPSLITDSNQACLAKMFVVEYRKNSLFLFGKFALLPNLTSSTYEVVVESRINNQGLLVESEHNQ